MDFITELDSVAAVLSAEVPGTDIKYDVPKEPASGQLIIRAQRNELVTESHFTTRIERLYQIIYFSNDPAAAISAMDRLSRKLMFGTTLIPVEDGSFRYIRIESFSFSDPVETESGLAAVIATMPTSIRQARDRETFVKITKLNARINP
ncbi:hypothetical protein [Paenibacillus sp. 1P03SA]|uniref:hypothetical protein n=1 Tax=Paenibacillus sp. 1P03SA TaxID=3132294 RepID=UPI0039A19A13